jgi:hypothetical protein
MHPSRLLVAAVALLLVVPPTQAGLYYSGEAMAELPSQWRGFLIDQRLLRTIAVKPAAGSPVHPARQRYEKAAAELEKAAASRKLTADEQADLGALYVRLGEAGKAVELLRAAQRDFPNHFRIVANLGTAWQLQGDLNQAAACLQQAVRLAPGKLEKAEEYHLKLVRLRQQQARDTQDLDDLFGVRYLSGGKFEPGKMDEAERKKLPAGAAAIVQQLALWLPADGKLLWQLAELANAHGDVRNAAAIMDGCVTEFGMSSRELRQRRQRTRDAADKQALAGSGAKTVHEGHVGGLAPRSKRPLLTKLDAAELPPISADGINPLPWSVVTDTSVDRKTFKPTFPKYLKDLDGKQVSLSGFMQPLGDDLEVSAFMLIEYPVGCWYCEVPDVTNIVLVELPAGKTTSVTRGLVKITGKLALNASDPENFLYTISRVKVSEVD